MKRAGFILGGIVLTVIVLALLVSFILAMAWSLTVHPLIFGVCFISFIVVCLGAAIGDSWYKEYQKTEYYKKMMVRPK